MIITAQTTDEQILAPVVAAKQDLAASVARALADENFAGDRLVDLAQEIKNAEELARAQAEFRNILAAGHVGPEAIRALLRMSCAPMDDTWSGRKNDSRRAAREGVQKWITEQMWNMR